MLYRILHEMAPQTFTEVESLVTVEEWLVSCNSNTKQSPLTPPTSPVAAILQPVSSETQTHIKGNLMALIRHMNDHARNTLDAKRHDFNITAMVNVTTVVRGCTTSRCPSSTTAPFVSASPSPQKSNLRGSSSAEGGGKADSDQQNASLSPKEMEDISEAWHQFALLSQLFVAMVALSGVPRMLQCLKGLPREEQKVLSNLTREAMQHYGLKSTRASVDRRGSVMSVNRYTSPYRNANASTVLQTSSSVIGSVSTLLPTGMDGMGGGAGPGSSLAGDGMHYRMKAMQLGQEVEEWKSRAQTLESQYALLMDEKKVWDYKYRKLLDEVEKEPSEDLVVLQASLAQKDETIEALRAKVLEQQEAVSAMKQASSVHQLQNDNLKRKLKQQEEVIVRFMEDRREMESKLQLAEDKLEARTKAYQTLEVDAEKLRSELKLLQLSKPTEGGGGGGNEEEQRMLASNVSFTSTGSVGRTLGLEKELREVRRQRDNFQKQIQVLQRQFAAATAGGAGSSPFPTMGAGGHRGPVSPSAGIGGTSSGGVGVANENTLAVAAYDTLKAQLRQLEREKHQQKHQLKEAQSRIKELEGQLENAKTVANSLTERIIMTAREAPASNTGVGGPTSTNMPAPSRSPRPGRSGKEDEAGLSLAPPLTSTTGRTVSGKDQMEHPSPPPLPSLPQGTTSATTPATLKNDTEKDTTGTMSSESAAITKTIVPPLPLDSISIHPSGSLDLPLSSIAGRPGTQIEPPLSATTTSLVPPLSLPSTSASAEAAIASLKQQVTMLTSLLLSYGYQNSLLQQHDLLLFRDRQVGYMERYRQEKKGRRAVMSNPSPGGIGARLLSMHRRVLEQGMLESVVHHYVGHR